MVKERIIGNTTISEILAEKPWKDIAGIQEINIIDRIHLHRAVSQIPPPQGS